MGEKSLWERRTIECPEEKRTAKVLIEWQTEDGERLGKSMSCDNPRLRDIDNWDCHWSCWEAVQKGKA